MRKALILGAGPIGLVTGWKLLEHGWQVDIFEKDSLVGGMCKTWKWHDFLVDVGPHIFHTPDPKLAEFWEAEFGDLFIKGDFWCKNVKGERFDEYHDYPMSWEGISRLPPGVKKQVLGELENLSAIRKAKARNFKEYVTELVGPTLQGMFYEKYPRKIWGIPTEEMTPEWAPKRIQLRSNTTPFYHGQWNAVGKFGTGCIYDRIRDKILALGGRIHLENTVTAIKADGKSIVELGFKDRPARKVEAGDVVISSLPITLTARLLGYPSHLKFRGIISVYLAYRKKTVLPEGLHWLYFDSERLLFNRVTESKKMAPATAPEDKTFLTFEIAYSRGDDLDRMDEAELMQAVIRDAEKAGLAKRDLCFAWDLHKEPFVYPLMYTGYRDELSKTRAVLGSYSQLYSLGTGGDFNYADSQILFHKAFDLVDILTDSKANLSQIKRQNITRAFNPVVDINGRKVGDGHPAYVIAEAGLNHNGSLEIARQLIAEAKKAGCDAVKFQTFKAKNRVSAQVKSVKYAETVIGLEETILEVFARLELSADAHRELFAYARELGIEVFSTPFDVESVDFLESLGVNLYKIASMDIVNLPLIRRVARTGKPLIISTGMSSLGVVEEAVNAVLEEGNPNLVLLHCNSTYPAAVSEMNLKAIQTMKTAFKVPVGLSDHTFGLDVSKVSLAVGANCIERHFTIDKTLEGPDHILSSLPEEMAALVQAAQDIPAMLGDGIKRIQPNEYYAINQQRKSLYAKGDIKKGAIITENDVAVKGPGGGLMPRYLEVVVGRRAARDIQDDFPITWEDI